MYVYVKKRELSLSDGKGRGEGTNGGMRIERDKKQYIYINTYRASRIKLSSSANGHREIFHEAICIGLVLIGVKMQPIISKLDFEFW